MVYEYDATDEKCPLPLVKTRLLLKKLKAGDTCILRLGDKGSKSDIPKLLIKQGYLFNQRHITNTTLEIEILNRKLK
jgi:tRNA 2-thiouridine synthesizing protein A